MPPRDSLKSAALGELHTYALYVVPLDITADASSGIAYALPFLMEIVDVVARSTATVASASVTVSDGTNDITEALSIITIDSEAISQMIDTTYATTRSVTLTTNGPNDRARVFIMGRRTE